MEKIVLASGSPRRKELLEMLGLKFEIMPDDTPENMDINSAPETVVCDLARFKGRNVIKNEKLSQDSIVIAADTVVVVNGKIIGKPKSENNAAEMLRMLSGYFHEVYTGVFVSNGDRETVFCERTRVDFKVLTDAEIAAYIKTGEPMDKAGAYGIQGIGSMFVKRVDGDFFNVVGLPVCRLSEILKNDFNIRILD